MDYATEASVVESGVKAQHIATVGSMDALLSAKQFDSGAGQHTGSRVEG